MNIPINCPICGDPLTNIFNETTNKVVYKNCRLRSDHIFSCTVYLKGFWEHQHLNNSEDTIDRVAFTLSMNPMLSVVIYPVDKRMKVDRSAPDEKATLTNSSDFILYLPFYVEPDFSDYKKLVKKIKTYLLFS